MSDNPLARYSGALVAATAVCTAWAFWAASPLAAPLAVVFTLAAVGWALYRLDPEFAQNRRDDGTCRGCRAGCPGCRERIDAA